MNSILARRGQLAFRLQARAVLVREGARMAIEARCASMVPWWMEDDSIFTKFGLAAGREVPSIAINDSDQPCSHILVSRLDSRSHNSQYRQLWGEAIKQHSRCAHDFAQLHFHVYGVRCAALSIFNYHAMNVGTTWRSHIFGDRLTLAFPCSQV